MRKGVSSVFTRISRILLLLQPSYVYELQDWEREEKNKIVVNDFPL